jgi:GT2 family glycosyltransferase
MDVFAQCIESLRSQTLSQEQIRLIVVNDCSTDGAEAYLADLVKTVPNLTVISHDRNRGLSAARNSGLDVVKDGVVLFLDSDMVACSTLLEQHLDRHSQPDTAGLAVVSNVTYPAKFVEGSNFSRYMQARELGFRSSAGRRNLDYNDLPYNFFAGGATSVKADFARTIGGFDTNFTTYGCEDEEFGWRFKNFGGKIVFVEQSVVFHHDVISMQRVKRKMMEAAATSYKIIAENNPAQISGTKAQYAMPLDFTRDSLATICVKVCLSIVLNRVTVGALEFVAKKTDGIRTLYCEAALRALTAGWMVLAASGKQSDAAGVWK